MPHAFSIRRLRRILPFLFTTFAVLLAGAPVPAALIVVSSLADDGPGSLREATESAAAGDTIGFAITGTVLLTSGPLLLDQDLVIDGPGSNDLAIGAIGHRVLEITAAANVTVRDVSVQDGLALDGAGIRNAGTLLLERVVVRNHYAEFTAAGIWTSGPLVLRSCLLYGNDADRGGAIHISAPGVLLEVRSTVFLNNRAVHGGGAIFVGAGQLLVEDSRFEGNQSDGGGAIDMGIGAIADIRRSLFVGNDGHTSGGGAVQNAGTMTLTNSTLSGNRSDARGGAIVNRGSLTTDHCTITLNEAELVGGVHGASGTFSARNTIFAGNIVSGGGYVEGPDFWGTLTSLGHNVIQDPLGTVIAGDTTGNLIGVDPMLQPLADNGGPTWTHAVGAPVIDAGAGDGGPTDQRGAPRVADGNGDGLAIPDIGAFELQPEDCTDLDGDGFGMPTGTSCPGGPQEDCDDDNAAVYPGAPEACDGLDNDCDGVVDGFATSCGQGACFATGICDAGTDTCVPSAPVPEICDGLDNDCDGIVPVEEQDADGDGVPVCAGDCNDANPDQRPGNPESCDNLDNDCDGTVDGFATACGTGACSRTGQCVAGADSCTPGDATPESCDGLDNDCDGVVDAYPTACGVGACAATGLCAAGTDTCLPSSPSPEICDGIDNDCNGELPPEESDGDGDGFRVCEGDCDDGSPLRFPGNPESCDGLDNDCDGAIDGFATACGVGACQRTGECLAGADTCSAGSPAPEVCDGLDNDCDGVIDSYATACGLGACAATGFCAAGSDSCVPSSPSPEVCDGIDNDCDGVLAPDELDADTDGFRGCDGDCNDASPLQRPGLVESCDNLDNDCDGTVDGFATVCGVGECSRVGQCIAGVDDCVPGTPVAELCDGLDNNCDNFLPPLERDYDGDGVMMCEGDCSDLDPQTYPGAPEALDGRDNQCPGDAGYGILDDLSGTAGFPDVAAPTRFCWEAQAGASLYEVRRLDVTLPSARCDPVQVAGTCWEDPALPLAGKALGYLVRGAAPLAGSWGADSSGAERGEICAAEGECADGIDNDADGRVDCQDTADCFGDPACPTATASFVDSSADDLPAGALEEFFVNVPAGPSDYLFLSFQGAGSVPGFEWCAERADAYRDAYLSLAATGGLVNSGGWNIWYREPGGTWNGPWPTEFPNVFGTDCLGAYSWCTEAGLNNRSVAIDPGAAGACEAFDLIFGCEIGTGLTLVIGVDRSSACGF